MNTSKENQLENEISNSNIKINIIDDENNHNTEYDENVDNDKTYDLSSFLHEYEEKEIILRDDKDSKRKLEEEEKLSFLYHKYTISYKKKNYINIIKDINNIRFLFSKNSQMSFNIFILKIKCFLKIIKKEYIKFINLRAEKIYLVEISKIIAIIQKDFEFINIIVNSDSKKNYELITQIFGEYIFYLSLVSRIKEEYIKSFAYLTMGINSLKIYFIKQGIASDIKTYVIYIRLLLLLTNYLIANNNFNTAIFYCNVIFKISEVAFKCIKKNKIGQKYQMKIIEYIGYNYLYTGLCLEQIDYNKKDYLIPCFEAYKEAKYFFKVIEIEKSMKSIFRNIFKKNNDNRNICQLLSEILLEKIQKKLEEEKYLQEFRIKQLERSKKPSEIENDKKKKLKLIANGFNQNITKFVPLENNIYNSILTSKVQTNINRLDNELISVIYKEDNQNASYKPISTETKKNLCQLKVYDILMSNDFREYILKNKYFEFNNPTKEKESIEKLQNYLNKRIRMNKTSKILFVKNKKINSFNKNILLQNENNKTYKLLVNLKNKKNIMFKKIETDRTNKSKNKNKNNILNHKLSLTPNNKYINSRKLKEKINKEKYNNLYNTEIKNMNNSESKKIIIPKIIRNGSVDNLYISSYKDKKNQNNKDKEEMPKKILFTSKSWLENDFEKKNLDKELLSKNYFKKFFYLDSLTDKELSFQKKVLNLKGNNSKLYFGDYIKELKNGGKISKEDTFREYLLVNHKAVKEAIKNQNTGLKEEKSDFNIFGNSHSVLKVLNKYITSSKEKKLQIIKDYSESPKNIKKNNEDKILNLNKGIKEIKNIIDKKTKKLKRQNFKK